MKSVKALKALGNFTPFWNAVKNFLKFNGIVIQRKPPFKRGVKY